MKRIRPLCLNDLRKLRGDRLKPLMRAKDRIPSCPGIYIWRFWPSFPDMSEEGFVESLMSWAAKIPSFSDLVSNSRVQVQIVRTPLGSPFDSESFLGLNFKSTKVQNFLEVIRESSEKRGELKDILECMIASFPPLYIGKADNLKNRLSDHFNRKTPVLSRIESSNVSLNDIYISFIADTVSDPEISITTMIEEILQRITNPPLTKRYG